MHHKYALTSAPSNFASTAQILAAIPESLGQLAMLIGVDNMLAIVEQYGGTAVWVPTMDHCTLDHPLAQIIGLDALKLLAHQSPSQSLRIPIAHALRSELRAIEIHQLKKTMSNRAIARHLGITERGVRNILARRPLPVPKSTQPDLFAGE